MCNCSVYSGALQFCILRGHKLTQNTWTTIKAKVFFKTWKNSHFWKEFIASSANKKCKCRTDSDWQAVGSKDLNL